MEILQKSEYQEYEEFVKSHKNSSFMQSINWANVKNTWKHEVVVSRDKAGKIKGGVLILIKEIKKLRTSLFYSPRGPVCDYEDIETLEDLLNGVKKLSKKYKAYQFKVDPQILETETKAIDNFIKLGFNFEKNKKDFETIQTRHNYMLLDIDKKTEDEIFNNFHKKWRYNVRVALKHDVKCNFYNKEYKENLQDFYDIYIKTAERDGFLDFREISYFENLLDNLKENIRLYICYYNNKAVSGAITINYGDKTSYVYGASDNEFRNVMPNHLMQWEMIKWAKSTNCRIYDFQGIPVDIENPKYMAGVYRFKKGFNGNCVMFAGEFDYNFNKFIATIIKTLLKIKKTISKLKLKISNK